jgi:hypothetical protein
MASTISAGTTSGTALNMAADTTGNLAFTTQAGANTITVPNATGTMMVSGNMPAFSAYLGSSQTVTAGVTTKIQFNTEDFDTSSAYDNATNYRYTPLVAGYYAINIGCYVFGAVTQLNLYVYKNGSGTGVKSTFSLQNSASSQICTFSQILYLNGTTDYIEGYGLPSGAGSPAFQPGNLTFIQAYLVRAA